MSSFIRIVKNYEKICRLGHSIINHKDLVRRSPPEKLSEEFKIDKSIIIKKIYNDYKIVISNNS